MEDECYDSFMNQLIVAYDMNRGVGIEGDLPWAGQLPADMRHFRELTLGAAVIMGRATYESIGRPLPHRQNIVLSRRAIQDTGISVAHTLDQALESVEVGRQTFIIGGGEVYRQSVPLVDLVHATEVHAEFKGVDAHFPELQNNWSEQPGSRVHFDPDDNNDFSYSFVTYMRS
ncbi:MAG: dihydrofolate reductase [Chloroflexi bacterium]|nr:MAG: dihydrofolate reductase [Chloroflexota bacterium]